MRTRDEQIKPWGYISPFAKKSLQDRERCDLTITRKSTVSAKMALYTEEHILEAEHRAEQRVRAEIAKRHTWFYMVDDPESGHADMADMLCETNPFEIVETSEAADIRLFFAFQDEDGEIHEFSTREEAEQAAKKPSTQRGRGMMNKVQEYLESGMYLPPFMRDFHDQKDVFKFLDDVQEANIEKHRNGERGDIINWRDAQVYTIDIFLWVMARHGYTLQRSRKKLPFSDIDRTIEVENDRRRKEMAEALGGLRP